MTLHPAVFGDGFYMFGSLVIILGFVGALFFFLKALLMDFLGADWFSYGIVACVFAFMFLQFVPSPVEGLFWYNASVLYTGMTSVALVMFGVVIKEMVSPLAKRLLLRFLHLLRYLVPVFILAFVVGGGNFVTALTSIVILALMTAFCFKHIKRFDPLGVLIIVLASFSVSITAPGNAVRQEAFERMNPLLAILSSFRYAVHPDFIGYLRLPVVALFVLLTPLLYRIAKGSRLSFKFPYLVVPVMYGVYASTFTPNLFAWSDLGPHRVLNMNFFALLMFLLFSIIYVCGSIARKSEAIREAIVPIGGVFGLLVKWRKLVFYPAALALFALSSLMLIFNNVNAVSGVSATRSLINGEAAAYHQEQLDRLEILRSDDIQTVEFYPLVNRPHVLFFYDITTYYDYWRNVAFARFYGLERAVIIRLP